MRRLGICAIIIAVTFSFTLAHADEVSPQADKVSPKADEISELKEELKAMRKQMEEQANLLEAQKAKIEELESKIGKLESGRAAEPPKEEAKTKGPVEDRVTALEDRINKKGNLEASWKDGLSFSTPDKKFDLKVGGRAQFDSAWFSHDGKLKRCVGESKDRAETRSFRLNMKGTVYENLLYKIEGDFATGTMNLNDAYIGVQNIPYIGTILAGHQYEPFGLENMTSSNYLTFLEYALPEALIPARNLGIAEKTALFDQKMTLSTGIFQDADNQGKSTSSKYNWTSRATFLPLYNKEEKRVLHLGTSYSLRFPKDTIQYRSQPEAHLAQYFVDTRSLNSKSNHILGAEALLISGPISIQGEYVGSVVHRWGISDDNYFQGGYVYGSYFLTGESRPYDRSQGVLSRVIPLKNFSPLGEGFGAWELASRYSFLDLHDDSVSGGMLHDLTLGLNWYLNPNIKLMMDYIYSHREDYGDANIVQTRFHVDF